MEKLKSPILTSELIIKKLKLKISKSQVNRVITRWGLNDKNKKPIALNEYMGTEKSLLDESFKPWKTACNLISEKEILENRRINRHFELICKKMKTHAFHICDPGPLLLAPFVNSLGIVQAFELYGPEKLRGKEITNLALLNVFRILAGYRRINNLSNNRDKACAFASGLGLYGSSSKYYEKTIAFTFDILHKLRCDLVATAKHKKIIEGKKVGYDFHLKEFYGNSSDEKEIGKGPDKAGNMVPAFRPHVAWDLASNVIINMAYFQGATRAPRVLRRFCEQNIFPIFNPLAIKEIYMDSEYTKEGDIHYFKEITCKNGDVYICLRKNKQIKKIIKPALEEQTGWENYDSDDEAKEIEVQLPKTGIPLK